jgi:hypothetical protein
MSQGARYVPRDGKHMYRLIEQMPHVRASEYQIPSSDYELQYVEVIQRHHKVSCDATSSSELVH